MNFIVVEFGDNDFGGYLPIRLTAINQITLAAWISVLLWRKGI